MNWLLARLKESSTKRGLVWLIAGTAVLFGYEIQPEQLDRWIGIAMAISGLLGWLPDEQPKKMVEYTGPARSDDHYRHPAQSGVDAHSRRTDDDHSVGMQPVQSRRDVKTESDEPSQSGWNG